MSLTHADIKNLLQDSDTQRRELLDQCRSGDRKAFNRFVQQHQDAVYAHVLRIVGRAKALAITRDVFVAAYTSMTELPGITSVESWLFRIAEKRQSVVRKSGAKHGVDVSQDQREDTSDDLLIAYMDGELEEADIQCVEQRLERDSAYRQEFEQAQQVDEMLQVFSHTPAPPELRVLINTKLDEKSFWEKICEAIEIFRQSIPERRLVRTSQIAYALGSVLVILFGAWLYQFQQLQIQRITIQELQQRVQRSGGPTIDPSQITTSFVILTGRLVPQEISLDDARKLSTLTAELVEGQEPLWIPGGIDDVTARLQERIAPLFWKQKHERSYQQGEFTISEISLVIPENTAYEFSLSLRQLHEESASSNIPDVSTILIVISIIDKR